MVQEPYKGDYEIRGKTVEGYTIKANIANANFQVIVRSDNSKNLDEEDKLQQIEQYIPKVFHCCI